MKLHAFHVRPKHSRKLEKRFVDMQNYSGVVGDDREFVPPIGFRFHPKDKELIHDHLYPKVLDSSFSALAVGEVDFNKFEPWELPWLGTMGEDDWYFFCLMYKKFPTSSRTNRATPAGHWKATGKDKEIYMGKALVGIKKTLVFYRGRAPNGQKTNWVMHEYKLAGIYSPSNLPNTAQNDWVICRVFLKTLRGQKVHKSNLMSSNPYGNETSPVMPPLVDSPTSLSETITTTVHETSHVTCFSHAVNGNNMQEDVGNMQYPEPVPIQQDQSRSRMLVDSNGPIMHRDMEAEIKHDGGGLTADVYPPLDTHDWQQSFGVQEDFLASDGEYDFDSLPNFWN